MTRLVQYVCKTSRRFKLRFEDRKMENQNGEGLENGENGEDNELPVIDAEDLDEDELEGLRGDRVGNTVYSARWIIGTLLALSKRSQICDEGLSDELDAELCLLWDMSVEKDIVEFLMDNEFLKMAKIALDESSDPRLTEIILGIVSNMCCQPNPLETVGNSSLYVSMIFGHLTSDDPDTLIQVLRLLQCGIWDIQRNETSIWLHRMKNCPFLSDAITFILHSSTNDDLLNVTVELLQLIATVDLPNERSLLIELFKSDQLIASLVESFMQFLPVKEDDDTHSPTEVKFIENWLIIVSNLIRTELGMFTRNKLANNFTKIMKVFLRILQPYKYPSNVISLDDTTTTCLSNMVEMILWFQRNKNLPNVQIIHALLALMHGLRIATKDAQKDSFTELDESITELLNYLESYWIETIRNFAESKLLEIMGMCDNDVAKTLREVATEHSPDFREEFEKFYHLESSRLNVEANP